MKLKLQLPRFRRTRAVWRRVLALYDRMRGSIRAQLILTFAICLLAAMSVAGIAASVFKGDRMATVTYANSTEYIDRKARVLAEQLSQSEPQATKEQVQTLMEELVVESSYVPMSVMVTDHDGNVTLRTKNTSEVKVDIHAVIGQAMDLRHHEDWEEGRKEFVSFYPVKLEGADAYLLVSGIPQPSISYVIRQDSLMPPILSVITFFVLFFYLTKRKLNYLRDLAQGLLVISEGNLHHRVKERGTDELHSLAFNINHMTDELRTKIEAERRAEQVKNELITNVSHDLRTPLTSIMGYLRLLNDGRYETPEQHDEFLRIVYGKSEQLKRLIEDLFEFTKLTNPGFRLHKREIDLNALLEQLIEEYVRPCEESGLTLQKQLPAHRVLLELDPDKFVRVLENLLGNSVKYSDKPGVVRVELEEEEDHLLLSVINQGDPIAEEDISRLFERFYRVDAARTSTKGGSGLGLAIAKSIVELHGGVIWAECEGREIAFRIRLRNS